MHTDIETSYIFLYKLHIILYIYNTSYLLYLQGKPNQLSSQLPVMWY